MDTLVPTRRSLHAVAETLLAGYQWRVAATIRLVAAPGGFATGTLPGIPMRLAVRGTDLVVTSDVGSERLLPLVGTLGDLAAATGVPLGAPEGLYADGTGANAETVLDVDDGAAATIARAFAVGDEALRALVESSRPPSAESPVLWPEHFDLGVSLGEVNYGVSAGDAALAEPYAYVGPWTRRAGVFWDRPFGAARPMREFAGPAELLAFLVEGRDRAQSDPPAQ